MTQIINRSTRSNSSTSPSMPSTPGRLLHMAAICWIRHIPERYPPRSRTPNSDIPHTRYHNWDMGLRLLLCLRKDKSPATSNTTSVETVMGQSEGRLVFLTTSHFATSSRLLRCCPTRMHARHLGLIPVLRNSDQVLLIYRNAVALSMLSPSVKSGRLDHHLMRLCTTQRNVTRPATGPATDYRPFLAPRFTPRS